MDKDSAVIIIVGLGITFGFLGFLAYMMAQQRNQEPVQQVYVPQYVTAPAQSVQQNRIVPIETEETRPTKPHIMNHVLNTANTWYEVDIPRDIRTWSMNARGEYDLFYSFEPSHATYRTLFSGMFLDSDTAPNNINKIYVSSATSGAVVELIMFR